MRRIIVFGLVIVVALPVLSQDMDKIQSKMDRFVSKTGSILKFTDYEQPGLKTNYDVVETKIRTIESVGEIGYFFQILKEDKYDTKVASIEYEDMLEVVKAITSLKGAVAKDLNMNPSYLENKFITEDGFQIGYYVSKGNAQWFITLEKYGKGNTVFVKDVAQIETAFAEAIKKIEESKN